MKTIPDRMKYTVFADRARPSRYSTGPEGPKIDIVSDACAESKCGMRKRKKIIIMKKNMILFTTILGIAVATMAFDKATDKKETKIGNEEFVHWNFVGAENPANNDPTDPSQYVRATGPQTCIGSTYVCQISAPEDGSTTPKPDMTATEPISGESVADRIEDAFPTSTNETLLSYKSSL